MSINGIKNNNTATINATDEGIFVPNKPGAEDAVTGVAAGWLISIPKILFKISESLQIIIFRRVK
jgi:hypothetical protein